jgi:hypothetical protein
MATKRKPLSWRAVRRGAIYCAQACGHGCTYEAYKKAQVAALKMAVRLSNVPTDIKGGKWKVRVWENLGWHWEVTKGSVSLYYNSARSYCAFFNLAGPWGGNLVVDGKTPEDAVGKLMAEVRLRLKSMTALASRLEG